MRYNLPALNCNSQTNYTPTADSFIEPAAVIFGLLGAFLSETAPFLFVYVGSEVHVRRAPLRVPLAAAIPDCHRSSKKIYFFSNSIDFIASLWYHLVTIKDGGVKQ